MPSPYEMPSPYDYILDERSLVCAKKNETYDNCTITVTCNECRAVKTTIIFKRVMEFVNGVRIPQGGLANGDNIPLSIYYSHKIPGNGWAVYLDGAYCPDCRKKLGRGPYYGTEKVRD